MPPVETLLATTAAETVGVVAAVLGAAVIGALVGAVLTRRRRPPADPDTADARIAALWAGTRPEPITAVVPPPPELLAMTVWRLPSDRVLGLVLDALGDLGFTLVEVHGDRAILTTAATLPADADASATATAVASYGPTVPIDETGQGLQVRVELSGRGAPGLAAALRRRLVLAAPAAGPVGLLEDPPVSARAGAPPR